MPTNNTNSKKIQGRPEGSKYFPLIQNEKAKHYSQSKVAKILGISISTVKRYWDNGIFG
ncbi:sigma-70 family RNA polymerase sigma factor [Yersinia enterocolitica]|jgi:DNA invertase Pin-like site-specific DNA recombinase|uniref:DNA-binding protein n=1 Tax=Enterobacterales TaxID=91347 RepID=UPI000667B9F7|nr:MULTISPECIES: DNA-binding protein [Enterobacteriaceae]AUV25346.1 transcriptional regulator [Citrobacter freundii complex sp. CFNIH3]EKN3733240.1 sigma-70 family RNA polymerase sigma factor [Yersinia enterocolitica]EIF8837657.1 sigma-70 family RNA polymerase sigma factor [Escherichia coli]EKN5983312.1 sigma-70 family RNA polymerase sigma factor [Yersinia enterocolitica]EKN5987604.1 sigma-70 family RNA polymerase sigma factor [Yersinia enterocolitica]